MNKTTGILGASVAALALSMAAPSTAHAQVGEGRNFGLGLALGYPDVGLTANVFVGQRQSLQFVASFWYQNGYVGNDFGPGYVAVNSGIFLRGDYLFHPNVLTRGRVAALEWYIGPGVNFGFGNNDWYTFGAEMPIGLSLQFQRVPLELALEAVPRLNIVNPNGAYLYFGVGGTFHVRFYF